MKVSFRRFAYNIFFRLSPILIVILLELALRFVGIGESYIIFKESEDKQFYELNDNYYKRFISPKQYPDIAIFPQHIPVQKDENSYRIFLIGDQTLFSAFPTISTEQLIPDFKDNDSISYDIVQIAVPYTNSFAIKRLVRCINRYDADACVIFSGQNEFYGIPRKSSWMQDIDNYWGITAFITMKNHRFIQILDRFVYLKKDKPTLFPPADPDEWSVAYESDDYMEAINYFERNLKKINKTSKCPVFYVTMPSNIKTQPYRSLFDDKELSDNNFAKECAILVHNSDRFTIDRWINDLQAWEPETAIYYYCKGMIAEHEGNDQEALDNYNKALALDVFRVRMEPKVSELIKQYSQDENAELIDVSDRMKDMVQTNLNIQRYFSNGLNLNTNGKQIVISEIKEELISYFKDQK
jgi:tetratricopeptide (TPR) repeat protein